MKYLFIIKRMRTIADEKVLVARIVRVCLQMQIYYEIVITDTFMQEETVVKLKTAIAAGEPLRIIVCGTLETLHFTINGFLGSGNKKIELGYLPLNNIYEIFGTYPEILHNHNCNIESLIYGNLVDMDAIKVNNRYCISAVNCGIDARYIRLHKWLMSVCPLLANSRIFPQSWVTKCVNYAAILTGGPKRPISLFINGHEKTDERYSLFVVANARFYGNGYCIPPAETDDGQLDLYLMRAMPLRLQSSALTAYRSGRILDTDMMTSNNYNLYRRIVKVTALFPSAVDMCLDGSIYVTAARAQIEVVPAAIRFILPNLSMDTSTSFGVSSAANHHTRIKLKGHK